MKNEILYCGYTITASAGYYWIQGFKTPYHTLKEAKEAVDFIEEETMYLQ